MQVNLDFSNRDLFNYVYIPLLTDIKRYLFLMWWAGSWKSVFISQKLIIKSFQINDNILCVRKVRETLKNSCYAELIERIREWDLGEYFYITKNPLSIKNKLTWCEFIFQWMDNPEKIKSIQWIAIIWIEEWTEITRIDFDQLDLRLRGKKEMQIIVTFNPVDPELWLNTDFWIHGNTDKQTCLHTTYKNNRFVWLEYEWVMERLKETNYNYYKIYALWEWGILVWLVFENWEIIKKIPEEAKFIWRWLDFWYTNDPTACIWVYIFNNSLILDEEIYETWLTNTYVNEKTRKKSIVWKFEDLEINKKEEIIWDSAEPKSIEEIYNYWYNIVPAKKWKDSVIFWIEILKQYDIFITAWSWNLQKEFRKYTRKLDKENKPLNEPIDDFNHWIDATRYVWLNKLKKSKKKVLKFIKV